MSEYTISIKFRVDAEDEKSALEQARHKCYDISFIHDNMIVACDNDELLKLKAYVKISSYRDKVVECLKCVDALTPTEISNECGIRVNHISNVLRELSDKGLILCINPENRKGRLYCLTNLGKDVGGIL